MSGDFLDTFHFETPETKQKIKNLFLMSGVFLDMWVDRCDRLPAQEKNKKNKKNKKKQ